MSSAEQPRWRRLGPDQRREEILACAQRLFAERPYAEVSTTEIAREAGIARGLLNHYFGTKRDLLQHDGPVTTPALRSDCSQCFGLCCVLLPFSATSGFGVDKPSGTPCLNLAEGDGCRIHATLREDGWSGCTIFECFGAGQQVSQVTYSGVSWREGGNLGEMAAVLSVMRQLHEMLVHLDEVQQRSPDPASASAAHDIEALTTIDPEALLTFDLDTLHSHVGDLLQAASERVRRQWPQAVDLSRRDKAGSDLRRTDLRGASLRGAVLIRADLREADLSETDLLGADLRDADLRGAHLDRALFLTQPQANSARGDQHTTLPEPLARPGHWS